VLEDRPPLVVTSQGLAKYLEEVVPLESGKIPGATVQYPDVFPSWRGPKDFYFGVVEQASSANHVLSPYADDLPGAPHVRAGPDDKSDENFVSVEEDFSPPENYRKTRLREADHARAVVDEHRKTVRKVINATVAKDTASHGRETFETRQGLTIIGGRMRDVAAYENRADLFHEDGAYHVRGTGTGPQAAALRIDGDRWAAALMLPDLVGVLHLEDGLVQSLNYVPARGGRFDLGWQTAYEMQIRKEARLDHRWMAMMSQGIPVEKSNLQRVANKTLLYKNRKSALGIAAAYGFERGGNWRSIDKTVGYFSEVSQEVPFDIALLPSSPRIRGGAGVAHFEDPALPSIAGTFPLLRLGWAMLDRSDEAISPNLEQLRSGVLPALWTTFEDKAGKMFAKLVKSGEL